MQTELMAATNTSQQFMMEVSQAILTHHKGTSQLVTYQALQATRINDALLFLQTADAQRNQEQAIVHRNLPTPN